MNFKQILIPTDFNEAATHALPFAKMVAEKLDATIRLVHVRFSLATAEPKKNAPDQDHFAPAGEHAADAGLPHRAVPVTTLLDSKVPVQFDFKQGLPGPELIKMTVDEQIDLMIIGSKGDYDVIDKWIGTVSTDVAIEGKCPVIVVPLKAPVKPIRQILYATDEAGINFETLSVVMEFARKMESAVHFIHIRKGKKTDSSGLKADYLDFITDASFQDIPFEINTIEADNITEGLDKYAKRRKMDMLVLVTRKKSGMEAFFHASITRKSLFYPWKIPVMVLHG